MCACNRKLGNQQLNGLPIGNHHPIFLFLEVSATLYTPSEMQEKLVNFI